MTREEELRILDGRAAREDCVIEIAGEQIEIRPFKFGKFGRVMELLKPMMGEVMLFNEGNSLNELLSDHHERVMDAITYLTDRPRDWVEGLSNLDAVRLVGALIRVNSDFFEQRLIPLLMTELSRLDGKFWSKFAMGQKSQTSADTASPSSDLSQTATDLPT